MVMIMVETNFSKNIQPCLDLAPIDPDGDIVRCRWATVDEGLDSTDLLKSDYWIF